MLKKQLLKIGEYLLPITKKYNDFENFTYNDCYTTYIWSHCSFIRLKFGVHLMKLQYSKTCITIIVFENFEVILYSSDKVIINFTLSWNNNKCRGKI